MLGIELRETGRVVHNDELMLVHVELKRGNSIPAHDHQGYTGYFTIVKGSVTVTLGGAEEHRMTPGAVLSFGGEVPVAIRAHEDSEFFVYLITKRG